jgi:putative phosphoribosyl transferase
MSRQFLSKEVSIFLPEEKISLKGILSLPPKATKIIVFAHGSGSGRNSPRNQFVAEQMVKEQLATLLLDLLTEKEEILDQETRKYRFDISLLAKRLMQTTKWLSSHLGTKHLKIGYFGASTGSAAALMAAAEDGKIFAIVSRGGRPDLALSYLSRVKAPTLLIVGENDPDVLFLNQQALEKIFSEKKLEIIPKATHLFEEKGALEKVSHLAISWFKNHPS